MKERDTILGFFRDVGLVTLSLNVLTMLVGFLTAKLFRLNLRQSITISIESGIQNGTMAIFVALSILHNSQMSISPAIYSLIMFATGGFMMYFFGKRKHI